MMAPKHKRRKQRSSVAYTILPQLGPERYLNRELSTLAYHHRVLDQARQLRHPLLERVKMLAISASILDEFFMVRVSGLRAQIDAGVTQLSPDGRTPQEQMSAIKPAVEYFTDQQRRLWLDELRPELVAEGIVVANYDELTKAQKQIAEQIYRDHIFPVLTPLAFDPGHPFPHISNLSLNLAVVVHTRTGMERFARIKIPEVLPRLLRLPQEDAKTQTFVWLEQVIAANLAMLFPGLDVHETYPFRVTRNADIELQEEEAADLLRTIEHNIRQRQFGFVSRLSVDATMPARILDILTDNMEVDTDDIYTHRGPLGLQSLMELSKVDRPDLKYAPVLPASVMPHDGTSVFDAIASHDIMLHHPYDSFVPVVDFIRAAAEDPQVLAIKQTLYRVGSDTPLVPALVRAREKGKQVTVLVELKARFDEENNIEWARTLEQAGVHVVYGLMGLKVHCKVALVVRKEGDVLRRYVHLSSGNYNLTTSHLYTDVGLLTADDDIGADASDVFNYLTGYSDQRAYRRFLLAPVSLRNEIIRLIERESAFAREGKPAHIIFKFNSLTDPASIEALYAAAQAGVKIDLIIRGVCCLRPGVAGLSETIMVRSIVGRFLEHSRLFYFLNGGNDEVYVGSADLMSRNLDRRVEIVFPVTDRTLITRLRDEVLRAYMNDTENASILQSDGNYQRAQGQALDVQSALLHQHTVLNTYSGIRVSHPTGDVRA